MSTRTASEEISPREMWGLKVLHSERCRLICASCCKRIFCVYKGRETRVGKHGAGLCEGFKRHGTRQVFLLLHSACSQCHLKSHRMSRLHCYTSSNVKESHPGCFLLPFAPVRDEQLGLCLLIIWLVWFSLFVFWSCASQPPLPSHRKWIKVICFFQAATRAFQKAETKQTKPGPKQLFFVPSLICQLYCSGLRERGGDYHHQSCSHKELMGCQYPWQQH